MPEPSTVCAVVVTHDRLPLLRRCLAAVLAQERAPDHVVVLDNASTDGTQQALAREFPQVEVVRLARNEGSSGGFHEGIAHAVAGGWDWIWVMDDDTLPEPTALSRLLAARADGAQDAVLLASRVEWTDGRLHPMNLPRVDGRDPDRVVAAARHGLLPIRTSTFPSLLVRRDAVQRHGPPRKAFWIWSDDLDFTGRILRHEPGYLVTASAALHATPTPHWPWQGGERFFYAVRNGLWLLRGDTLGVREKVLHLATLVEQCLRFLAHERARPRAWAVLARGLRDGLLRPAPR